MKTRYNIVTVATNPQYERFLILFLNSLFQNTDTSLINNVFILEKNINEELKNKLVKKYNKVVFENKMYDIRLPNVQSEFRSEWRLSVLLKSIYVYEKVKTSDLPTILIDLDSFFIKNFDQYIDLNYDIQVCERESPLKNKRIIASYISFNDKQKSIHFLEKWMELIKAINEDVVETTSLNLMCNVPLFKINRLSYKKVGYYYGIDEISEETSIFHLKGCNSKNDVETDITGRINRLLKKYSIEKYLTV